MKWIDVREQLPEFGEKVLCQMLFLDMKPYPRITTRTNEPRAVVDSNGFRIQSKAEQGVVAWMPIPKFDPKTLIKYDNRDEV